MSREIKFRAWDGKQMLANHEINGDWLLAGKYGTWSIMQFTGMNDKNGKEIYEGDIVKFHDHPTGVEDGIGDVYFKNGTFRVAWSMRTLGDFGSSWTEVIGNVYENGDLLTLEHHIR